MTVTSRSPAEAWSPAVTSTSVSIAPDGMVVGSMATPSGRPLNRTATGPPNPSRRTLRVSVFLSPRPRDNDAGTSMLSVRARSGALGGPGPAATGVGPGVPRGRPTGASTPRAHRPRTMTTDRAVSDRDRARTFRPRSLMAVAERRAWTSGRAPQWAGGDTGAGRPGETEPPGPSADDDASPASPGRNVPHAGAVGPVVGATRSWAGTSERNASTNARQLPQRSFGSLARARAAASRSPSGSIVRSGGSSRWPAMTSAMPPVNSGRPPRRWQYVTAREYWSDWLEVCFLKNSGAA